MAEPSATNMVDAETAAKLLMMTPHRIRQLVSEGWIPKAARNAYPLVGLVQGYIRFLKDEQRRANKVQAESRVRDARAREIELRIAEREGRLIETAEALTTLDEILGQIRSDLSGAPARITRDLSLRGQIEVELDRVLDRAADHLQQKASALRAGGDAAAPEPEDDA